MNEPIHIISLGAGVQSSTMALMAAAGEITPMPVAAIFADTQAEPASVYTWLDWLEPRLPFPVIRVTAGNLWTASTTVRTSKKTGQRYSRTLIPAFVDKGNGKHSLLGRKCTAEFKVRALVKRARNIIAPTVMLEWRRGHKDPLQRLSKVLKVKPVNWREAWPLLRECQRDALVVTWIGISTDEAQRMKPSREPWTISRWPLIDGNISRADCLAWMKAKGFPTPPRSACIFCPFHSDDEWRRQRDEEPEEFARSVQFERDLQHALSQCTGTARLNGKAWLHSTMKPLDEIDFGTATPQPSHVQTSLFGNECEGLCGV